MYYDIHHWESVVNRLWRIVDHNVDGLIIYEYSYNDLDPSTPYYIYIQEYVDVL